jgi:dihydrofolate synthase/folylpolyglutamate synthase
VSNGDTIEPEYAEVVGQLRHRWPDADVVPTLERVRRLIDLLDNPQLTFRTVHIGGTNGKSSTTRMVDALLREAGLRVGRFTSPEASLPERIALHGLPLDAARFVACYRELEPYLTAVEREVSPPLTTFEVMTPMAFLAFADAPVDAAAIEVGMGGAWDCTNVADGVVAVLAPIALDHQKYLGDTIEEIAWEKAGIIKPGATVICAAQSEDAQRPILERCAEVGATIAREGGEFGVLRRAVAVGGQVLTLQGLGGVYEDGFVPLHGAHEAQTAALALAAAEAFFGAGEAKQLDADLVRAGFAGAHSPGRLERVRSAPTILLDAAHNPHGMAATAAAVAEEFAFRRLVAVVAAPADKDVAGMLEALEPAVTVLVATRNSSPRSMPAAQLGALAAGVCGEDRVRVAPSLPDAIETAVELAEADLDGDLGGVGVLITGSTVTVADARRLLT